MFGIINEMINGIANFITAIPSAYEHAAISFYKGGIAGSVSLALWVLIIGTIPVVLIMHHLASCVRKECPHCRSRYFHHLAFFQGHTCLNCGSHFRGSHYGK